MRIYESRACESVEWVRYARQGLLRSPQVHNIFDHVMQPLESHFRCSGQRRLDRVWRDRKRYHLWLIRILVGIDLSATSRALIRPQGQRHRPHALQ